MLERMSGRVRFAPNFNLGGCIMMRSKVSKMLREFVPGPKCKEFICIFMPKMPGIYFRTIVSLVNERQMTGVSCTICPEFQFKYVTYEFDKWQGNLCLVQNARNFFYALKGVKCICIFMPKICGAFIFL